MLGQKGRGLSSALCRPKVGEVWGSNNINQCDTLILMGNQKIKNVLKGEEIVRGF